MISTPELRASDPGSNPVLNTFGLRINNIEEPPRSISDGVGARIMTSDMQKSVKHVSGGNVRIAKLRK